MACISETLRGQINVVLLKEYAIRPIWRSGKDEAANYADRYRYYGANDIHPSPTSKTVHSVKSRGSTSLNQTCCKGPNRLSSIPESTTSRNLIASVPRAKGVVHSREICCLCMY